MLQRTAKSCGPDAPTLASSLRSRVGPTGLRQDLSAGDGGKQARSPGRARRKPLKPLRAGTSGDSGVPVYSCAFLPMQSAHEAAGATGTRRSPRPLFQGRNVSGKIPGVPRRGVLMHVCNGSCARNDGQPATRRKLPCANPAIVFDSKAYGSEANGKPILHR